MDNLKAAIEKIDELEALVRNNHNLISILNEDIRKMKNEIEELKNN